MSHVNSSSQHVKAARIFAYCSLRLPSFRPGLWTLAENEYEKEAKERNKNATENDRTIRKQYLCFCDGYITYCVSWKELS
jgi:hypothetical protein